MAIPITCRAFWVACSRASSSMRRIRPAPSTRASFSIDLTRSRLASTAVSPEICSRRRRCSSMTRWISVRSSSTRFCSSPRSFSLRPYSSSRRSWAASLRSRFSSFERTRFSRAAISWRRACTVLSNSARAARTFSLASIEASRSFASAAFVASARIRSASVRMSERSPSSFLRATARTIPPTTAAMASPAAIAIATDVLMSAPLCPGTPRVDGGYTTRCKSLTPEGFGPAGTEESHTTDRFISCPPAGSPTRRLQAPRASSSFRIRRSARATASLGLSIRFFSTR